MDVTGLQGCYNFTFKFDAGPEGREPPWIILPRRSTAIQHLGLKLEARKMPVDRLRLTLAEKVPTEN